MNERQREAMEWTEGPELILAGAGSGKTRVLTHRIAYLIREKKVSPWNILAITFTNKAAAEMRSRVDALVESGAEAIWVATFHSSCVRILRRFIDRIGYDNHFTIYDADDQKAAMREVLKQLQIDPKQLRERVVLSAISAAKNEMVDSVRYESEAKDFQTARIARCYRAYQDLLRKNNALDFDDLLFKTVQLFEADADVLAYYQERFRYIMVDEYQDTNSVQFRLIELLAKKYRNLCVVGDDDQSIYKFRGANIHNILNFEKAFPGAKVVKLEQNYRSSGNILEAANGVIQNNAGRKEKRLWTAAESGEKVQCRRYASAAEEAEEIAAEIKARAVGDDYGRFAVLYRTNAQSRVLEERFVAAGIPYRLVGGVNFYQRREIKDILAYLKTVANAADDLAVQRILNVPKRGIGAATVTAVSAFAAERDLRFFEALREAARFDSRILIEECIVGREIECAVLGGGARPVQASGVGEILAAADFYDYDAKYYNAESKTVVDPELPEGSAEEVRQSAIRIFDALDGYGLSRVDFFVTAAGEVIFNEINTMPGFTAISMYPMLFAARGKDKKTLVKELMELAFEREA